MKRSQAQKLRVIQRLIENAALFFLYICSTDVQSSEVVFGGTDPNHYVGGITWIPLTSATYWQVKMDRYE